MAEVVRLHSNTTTLQDAADAFLDHRVVLTICAIASRPGWKTPAFPLG